MGKVKAIFVILIAVLLSSCSFSTSEYEKDLIRLKSRVESLEQKVKLLEDKEDIVNSIQQEKYNSISAVVQKQPEIKEILLTNENFFDYFNFVEIEVDENHICLVLESKLYNEGWIYLDSSYDFNLEINYSTSYPYAYEYTERYHKLFNQTDMNIIKYNILSWKWEFKNVYGIVRFMYIDSMINYEWNLYSGKRIADFGYEFNINNRESSWSIDKIAENYPF